MKKNKEIEVSFRTDKELWAELKAFCRFHTQKSGGKVLIKSIATFAIHRFISRTKNKGISSYGGYCLSEYKSLKKNYKNAIFAIWVLGINSVLNCAYLLLNYLGV